LVGVRLLVPALSKYKTSPTLPGREGRSEITLPSGLTFKFPDSGISAAVTTPNIFSTSEATVLSAFTKFPEESRYTKSPTVSPV
jgi:hypothetical protein